MICFPLRLTPSEPLFFAFFDLMNWKEYGIMVEYEKNNFIKIRYLNDEGNIMIKKNDRL